MEDNYDWTAQYESLKESHNRLLLVAKEVVAYAGDDTTYMQSSTGCVYVSNARAAIDLAELEIS